MNSARPGGGRALRGGAHDRAVRLSGGGYRLHVSITHEAGMAAAVALLEG